jgi:hypothetical protein
LTRASTWSRTSSAERSFHRPPASLSRRPDASA